MLTKWWKLELTLATNFGSHAQMVTKFGSQIFATKFGFVPDWSSYHHEIFRSYYQWQKWRPCKRSRSKVKVTEVNTQLSRFRTVTPVWIHIWWWNDAQSLMLLRRGALSFLAATKQLYKWYFPSVRLSVRLSVCLSHLFHHVPIIVSSWNFQELLPWSKVMSMQKVKVRSQRTRPQRSTPNLAVSGL